MVRVMIVQSEAGGKTPAQVEKPKQRKIYIR
jgi:hypothetical protein